jgi:hypothetical protein
VWSLDRVWSRRFMTFCRLWRVTAHRRNRRCVKSRGIRIAGIHIAYQNTALSPDGGVCMFAVGSGRGGGVLVCRVLTPVPLLPACVVHSDQPAGYHGGRAAGGAGLQCICCRSGRRHRGSRYIPAGTPAEVAANVPVIAPHVDFRLVLVSLHMLSARCAQAHCSFPETRLGLQVR